MKTKQGNRCKAATVVLIAVLTISVAMPSPCLAFLFMFESTQGDNKSKMLSQLMDLIAQTVAIRKQVSVLQQHLRTFTTVEMFDLEELQTHIDTQLQSVGPDLVGYTTSITGTLNPSAALSSLKDAYALPKGTILNTISDWETAIGSVTAKMENMARQNIHAALQTAGTIFSEQAGTTTRTTTKKVKDKIDDLNSRISSADGETKAIQAFGEVLLMQQQITEQLKEVLLSYVQLRVNEIALEETRQGRTIEYLNSHKDTISEIADSIDSSTQHTY